MSFYISLHRHTKTHRYPVLPLPFCRHISIYFSNCSTELFFLPPLCLFKFFHIGFKELDPQLASFCGKGLINTLLNKKDIYSFYSVKIFENVYFKYDFGSFQATESFPEAKYIFTCFPLFKMSLWSFSRYQTDVLLC